MNPYRFSQEAIKEIQILQMLNHPNIIRYYNSFQNKQSFHIIMEYAIHGTLENFVNKCSQTSNYIAQNVIIYSIIIYKLILINLCLEIILVCIKYT